MTNEINVSCLVERYWDVEAQEFVSDVPRKNGVLLDFSTQSSIGKTIPVGIVVFEDNTFEGVPLEFIEKIIN